MTRYLCPDRIFDGHRLVTGCLAVREGRVAALLDQPPPGAEVEPLSGLLTPGYLDLQVNGGGDVMVNSSPTAAAMVAIAAAHRRFGTVGILPTVITDAPEVLDQAVEAALQARGRPGILGLHIEGPHLSLKRRGTHAARFLRPLDQRSLDLVARLRASGIAVMITLAPEAVSPGQIASLVAMGAVVSLGHSDATAEEVQACLAEGASCFTHLFNAMSPMLGREPGMTGTAINARAHAGIIADGIHVADEMLALALRARPQADTTFLVSDAMSTVGGADRFTLYGQEIRLQGGRLVNAEGALAGAHITLAASVARLITGLGLDPAAVLRMATTIPARVMGLPTGLPGRALDDLLLLAPDWTVRQTGLS